MRNEQMYARTDPVKVMEQVNATVLPEGLEEKLLVENAEGTAKRKARQKRRLLPNGRLASKAQIAEMDERAAAIRKIAENTPEVRYREAGVYSDDEIKIIAAAIVSRIPLYKVAATLKCSLARILKAVEETPTLKQMMEEQKIQEKMMAQEAVDDCIKARVPAVVMWHAQHVLPEKYGDQVNMDNEDDTRIIIGGIDENEVAAAEKEVEEASKTIPLAGGGVALLDAMEQERAAEAAAAGGDISVAPLAQTPPAPSLAPPANDSRFGGFTPASELRRVPSESTPVGVSDDDFGDGGGFDDFEMDGSPF